MDIRSILDIVGVKGQLREQLIQDWQEVITLDISKKLLLRLNYDQKNDLKRIINEGSDIKLFFDKHPTALNESILKEKNSYDELIIESTRSFVETLTQKAPRETLSKIESIFNNNRE